MAVWRENKHKIITFVNSADHELITYTHHTFCMCLMSCNYHSMVSYHSAFTGVFIAAGVVGPCPVALWMLEPVTTISADLCNHLCRQRNMKAEDRRQMPTVFLQTHNRSYLRGQNPGSSPDSAALRPRLPWCHPNTTSHPRYDCTWALGGRRCAWLLK